ncbi:hypothetical protein NQZ68_025272 [Dissostichus eleginoides]|nr:hypothetical protein NQZ68_025272 [Dissostichus eleginoides]
MEGCERCVPHTQARSLLDDWRGSTMGLTDLTDQGLLLLVAELQQRPPARGGRRLTWPGGEGRWRPLRRPQTRRGVVLPKACVVNSRGRLY